MIPPSARKRLRRFSWTWRSMTSRRVRTVSADIRSQDGVDGWLSIEVSPLLAHNTSTTVTATKEVLLRAVDRTCLIKSQETGKAFPQSRKRFSLEFR